PPTGQEARSHASRPRSPCRSCPTSCVLSWAGCVSTPPVPPAISSTSNYLTVPTGGRAVNANPVGRRKFDLELCCQPPGHWMTSQGMTCRSGASPTSLCVAVVTFSKKGRRMPKALMETKIGRSADEVWARVREFPGLEWYPGVESCRLDGDI